MGEDRKEGQEGMRVGEDRKEGQEGQEGKRVGEDRKGEGRVGKGR